ncbi:N-6 DNA methylase [Aeromicrobium sp. IC_218]|uniref:HsdM family class I SAM-dependent methyltransferase n=1 Tax=Aeromicrobium sp. IC_218 TaxID=2545468 RepID=UPI0010388F6B|nr:N-6 DNA methylase [Aeromicrobium sp. IC_218]TCI97398.1 restriction endonuclease subunit M [Aeromicrobium sp. IC_218]
MAKEQGRTDLRAVLQGAGYRVIELERKLAGASNHRADAVAYASNADGDLVPWLVVEAKRGKTATPEMALPQLLTAREHLGTVEHYALINGEWFRADRSLRSFERVDGPLPPTHGDYGVLADVATATSLYMDRLWFEASKARGNGPRVDLFFPSAKILEETARPGIQTAGGEFVPVRDDVLWQARRRALSAFALRGPQGGAHTTAPVIADAVARLLGSKLVGTVLDPFCGTGNFLWSAMDRAAEFDAPVEFVGQEINVELAELAEQIGRTAPMLTTITAGDSFASDFLPAADAIVTAPPFGPQMRHDWTLLDGSPAREIETAAVDLCLRQLRPGARAVCLLPGGFTSKKSLEFYRRFLARDFRVGALIGLPAGAVEGTNLRAVLLVVDRAESGETFVAQLGDDWSAQLSATGAAMNAALAHLDGE